MDAIAALIFFVFALTVFGGLSALATRSSRFIDLMARLGFDEEPEWMK